MAAGARSGWRRLSPSYRSALIGSGRSGKLAGRSLDATETQRYWEGGGDLRGGRRHRPSPTGAAPAQATELESVGLGGPASYNELNRWRRRSSANGGPPAWLKGNDDVFSTDTMAILSQVDIPPTRWRSVQAEYLPGGQVIIRIQPKGRAYVRTVVFPDRQAASELMSVLRSPGRHARTPAERRRLEAGWGRDRGKGIEILPPINSK